MRLGDLRSIDGGEAGMSNDAIHKSELKAEKKKGRAKKLIASIVKSVGALVPATLVVFLCAVYFAWLVTVAEWGWDLIR